MKEKLLELKKATVCSSGAFGWNVWEVNDLLVERGPYAQYTVATHVSFKRPRKRSRDGFVETKNRVIVLEGWGHEKLKLDPMTKATEENGLIVSSTRFASFAPEYTTEFLKHLEAYVTEHKPVVHNYMK